ncbi:hypothetical protein CEQ90_15890 [Lewinellaceae bacterium SD302]|nr:hypothetical protein CEQ90_15890 [Lewinellaceae bacterium SD302]
MSIRKQASLIIYRFKERGLEVFMLNKSNQWGLPEGNVETAHDQEMIELDPCEEDDCQALAMEGDWHEIPSLKAMLYQDAKELKEKLKEIEGGTYVSIKEALERKLSPGQYQFLKELKDVLVDRNSVRDI